MAQKLSFYCENQPIFDLMAKYGDQLEDMPFESLLTYNAVVSVFSLYYLVGDDNEYPGVTFTTAVRQVWNGWREKYPQDYELCKAFCAEMVDGQLMSAQYLIPIQKGLAECIQCHTEY